MTQKSNKNIYIAAFTLFLAGLGFLIYSGLSENSVYFLNVSEALAVMEEDPAKLGSVRLFGTVAEKNLERSEDALGVRFDLEDKDQPSRIIRVEYKGAAPDTFKAGAEVIVEGGMKPGDTFKAVTLMTKCPSKYQKENRGE